MLDYYHDPQSGILKHKQNFEADKMLDINRDLDLQLKITLEKIKSNSLEEVQDPETRKKMRKFMFHWNKAAFDLSRLEIPITESDTKLFT